MADISVEKLSYYAPLPLDDDGTPLHNGERMVEIDPGRWVTPLTAAALVMFAEADHA